MWAGGRAGEGAHSRQPLIATQLGQLRVPGGDLGEGPCLSLWLGALFAEWICQGGFLEKAEDHLEPQSETR